MSHQKTIGMLVLAVSAVMAAAALVLPSMTMVAQAEQCTTAASSVDGSAFSISGTDDEECFAESGAIPPEPED
jgi:uncharacterized lipoprotein YajG